MICPQCKNEIPEQGNFCPVCGAKKTEINPEATSIPVAETAKIPAKGRKKKTALIIILSIIALIAITLALFFTLRTKTVTTAPVCEGTITKVQKLNSHQKIHKDYTEGKIDVNTYFTQLYYCEYDSANLDEKYTSDYKYYSASIDDMMMDLILEHPKEIDRDIIRAFVEKTNLSDVSIVYRGEDFTAENQSDQGFDFKAELLSETEEDPTQNPLELRINHELDTVLLSYNSNFLVWYTTTGADAITEEQAKNIASGLEHAVEKYKELFDVDFKYQPNLEISLGKDYQSSAKILKANGLSEDVFTKAMNVYIYDTGSDSTCATHVKYPPDEQMQKLANSGIPELFIVDGLVAHPYIQINRRAFDNMETLQQLYSHELFHEYQDIFTRESTGSIYLTPQNYSDATANLAAALVTEYRETDNFLNSWAEIYIYNCDSSLQSITDGYSYGYGVFPYLYIYSQQVDNWAENIMLSHNYITPFEHLQDYTDKEDLKAIADKLSRCILTNDFGSNALYNNATVTTKAILGKDTIKEEFINAGAFEAYEIKDKVNFRVEGKGEDSLVINLYGYKNGRFTELASGVETLSADTAVYPRYEKFYLTINNADIITPYEYSIKTSSSELAPNRKFETTFDNYNVNIEMSMSVHGIETGSVSTGVIDEMHQKQYLETTITAGDMMNLTTYSYYDFYNGTTYMTQPLNTDRWYKEKSAPQSVDLGVILEKLNKMKNTTEIDEDHYRVKLSGRDAKKMFSGANTATPSIFRSIYVDVYTQDGYITKLEYEFSKGSIGLLGDIQITMTFSDYNSAGDVCIPQEIINTATDEIISVPADFESLSEFLEENQSFLDTIMDMFS